MYNIIMILFISIFAFHNSMSDSSAKYCSIERLNIEAYLEDLENDEVFSQTGYVIYTDRTAHRSKRNNIEIFGNGTLLYIEYIDNLFLIDKVNEGRYVYELRVDHKDASIGYGDLEIDSYCHGYVIEDKDYAKHIMRSIVETEFFDSDAYYLESNTPAKERRLCVYLGNRGTKVSWGGHIYDEYPYTLIDELMISVMEYVSTEGENITAEEVIELKDEMNPLYFPDYYANTDYIAEWIERNSIQ